MTWIKQEKKKHYQMSVRMLKKNLPLLTIWICVARHILHFRRAKPTPTHNPVKLCAAGVSARAKRTPPLTIFCSPFIVIVTPCNIICSTCEQWELYCIGHPDNHEENEGSGHKCIYLDLFWLAGQFSNALNGHKKKQSSYRLATLISLRCWAPPN